MARNFDDILADITLGNGGHAEKQNLVLSDDADIDNILTVNTRTREIIVPENFDPMIAVTTDHNSNQITITIPTVIKGHDVSSCQRKTIKWLNEGSRERGLSELLFEKKGEVLELRWVIPPEATTAPGTLHFAICFCDLDSEDRVLYKWNSLTCKVLKVVQGLDEVAIQGTSLSKIITLDLYTRQFSLPNEFNRTIAYVGDNQTNVLTFRMDRFLNEIDFWQGAIQVKYTTASGETYIDNSISKMALLEDLGDNIEDDLIEFQWSPPTTLTQKEGEISIIISLIPNGTAKIWNSAPLVGLQVGEGKISQFVPETGSGELNLINKKQFMNLLQTEYGYQGG